MCLYLLGSKVGIKKSRLSKSRAHSFVYGMLSIREQEPYNAGLFGEEPQRRCGQEDKIREGE